MDWKPVWVITHLRGAVLTDTAGYTRSQSIAKMLKLLRDRKTWREIRRDGWRAQRFYASPASQIQ